MHGGFGRRAKDAGAIGSAGVGAKARTEAAPATATDAIEGADRRFAPRRKGQTPGFIFLDGGASIPCTIADMSTTGARLILQDGWSNPFIASEADRLTLVVRMDKVLYECRVSRREERELGVRFVTAPRPYSAPKKAAPAPRADAAKKAK